MCAGQSTRIQPNEYMNKEINELINEYNLGDVTLVPDACHSMSNMSRCATYTPKARRLVETLVKAEPKSKPKRNPNPNHEWMHQHVLRSPHHCHSTWL